MRKRQPPADRHKLIVNRQKCPRCGAETRAASQLLGYRVCGRCNLIVRDTTIKAEVRAS